MYVYLASTMRAILLIDQYGISHIVHDDIFKMYVGGHSWGRFRPGLDPHSVVGSSDGTVLDPDSLYRFFIWVFAQASDTNAMSRATGQPLHADVVASISNRNAIIAGLYIRICDVEAVYVADVNPICVAAETRCNNGNMINVGVVTTIYAHVKELAIHRCYVFQQ